MPDMCMCSGVKCPLAEYCYRHTVTPNPHRQSYFAEPPNEGNVCDSFIANKKAMQDLINSTEGANF